MDRIFQTVAATLGAICGFIFGDLTGALTALIALIVIDYITGVLVGISKKTLSSEIGFKGICKKVLILALVGVANIIDMQVIGSGTMIRTATIFFYLANEGISIVENAANLGLPVPKKIKEILLQIKDEAEENPSAEISE